MKLLGLITLLGLVCGGWTNKLGGASSSYLHPLEESASQTDYQYYDQENDYGEVPQSQQAGYGNTLKGAASGDGAGDLDADAMNLKMLMGSVPGTPGEDYPIYANAPDTDFSCSDKVPGGYYADPAAECQAYYVCGASYALLCPNGTIFNQEKFICDWWFNFDCDDAESFYSKNEEIAAEREAPAGAGSDVVERNELGDIDQYGEASTNLGQYGEQAAASAPESSYLPPQGRRGRKNGRRGKNNVRGNQKKIVSAKQKKKGTLNKRTGNKKKGKVTVQRSRNGKIKKKGSSQRKKNKLSLKNSRKQKKTGRSGRKGKRAQISKNRKAKANVSRNRKNKKGKKGAIQG